MVDLEKELNSKTSCNVRIGRFESVLEVEMIETWCLHVVLCPNLSVAGFLEHEENVLS